MSADLTRARTKLTGINALVRQKKYLAALQTLYETIPVIFKNPLLKQEKDEFERLITDATYIIMADPTVRKSAALELTYTPGKEKELMDSLRMLIDAFQDTMNDQVREEMAQAVRVRKAQHLLQGDQLLEAGDPESIKAARELFQASAEEFADDNAHVAEIGERLLAAKQYEAALPYLSKAYTERAESKHLFNSIAMAQRKLGKYPEAEQTYLKAAQSGNNDPNLFFNLGRLYLDWQKWEHAIKAGQMALRLDPNFEEAGKLILYAQRKLAQ